MIPSRMLPSSPLPLQANHEAAGGIHKQTLVLVPMGIEALFGILATALYARF